MQNESELVAPDLVPAGMEGLQLAHQSSSFGSNCKDLIGAESFSELYVDDDDDKEERRQSIAKVEERLLSFYTSQLEYPPRSPQKYQVPPRKVLPIHKPHAYPCQDTHVSLPCNPLKWPQRPVMLRPSPNTSTKIRGIRTANSEDYQHFPGFCAGCILPINTGREMPGESLVIDFETKHFCGTLLMRIKEAPPASNKLGDDSYFDEKKRKFQAVVKGKFKTRLKMSECVTGQLFDRPGGRMPARWIVSSFIKFVSTLAPQLEASLDSNRPRFLTPLVATAHTLLEKQQNDCAISQPPISNEQDDHLYNYTVYAGAHDIEEEVEEPPADESTSVMQHVPGASKPDCGSSVTRRQKVRKKAFNHIFAQHAEEPHFELDKEYTFEFYQHLLLFGESLAIDMGRPIGKVELAPVTDGQPIKFMSALKDSNTGELDMLWSFDIWHESLYPYAQAAEEGSGD